MPITPLANKGSTKNINFASGANTAVDMSSPQGNMTPQNLAMMASPDTGVPETAVNLSSKRLSGIVHGGSLTNTTLIGVSKTQRNANSRIDLGKSNSHMSGLAERASHQKIESKTIGSQGT